MLAIPTTFCAPRQIVRRRARSLADRITKRGSPEAVLNELELEPLGDRVVIFEPLNGAPPEEPSCLLWPLWLVLSQRCPAELHDQAMEWALQHDWALLGVLHRETGVAFLPPLALRSAFVRTWYAAWPRLRELGPVFVVNGFERPLTLPALHKARCTTLDYCLAQYIDHDAIEANLSTEAGPAALIDAEGNPLDPSLLLKDRCD